LTLRVGPLGPILIDQNGINYGIIHPLCVDDEPNRQFLVYFMGKWDVLLLAPVPALRPQYFMTWGMLYGHLRGPCVVVYRLIGA
jgi:hypothetical protein